MEGDIIDLFEKDTDRCFAVAKIASVVEKKLGDLTAEDKVGHEQFTSDDEMYANFRKYYNRPVDRNTQVKIIKFKLIN